LGSDLGTDPPLLRGAARLELAALVH
jgi:hypothetical protein